MAGKKILFGSVLFLLFLPLIHTTLNLFDVKPLDNMANGTVSPKFSLSNYTNLSYQDSFNSYAENSFGLRPFFIRMINEVNYDLFRHTKAPGIYVGKNDYLFVESYIENYLGWNFIGEQRILDNVKKIKAVQDSMERHGKTLLIVFAPGKATYHSEFIPEHLKPRPHGKTNYKQYAKALNSNGVNFIDFNSYFLSQKKNLKFPLYTSFGTHWTNYGLALAVDSISRFLEYKRHIDIPDLSYETVYSDTLRDPDYDVGVMLNLFRELPHGKMPYMQFKVKDKEGCVKPKALVVGDSYWWCVVSADLPSKIFAEDIYWSYNKEVVLKNVLQNYQVKDLNIKDEVSKQEVVIIMATEATFGSFPYGFVDQYYSQITSH